MNARFDMSRGKALVSAALTAIVASIVPGTVSAHAAADPARSEHWGVITRNTVGSPIAELRDGPFGKFGVQGPSARPPYGQGSLGIEVANGATSPPDTREKVDFGNEVDFFGDRVLNLNQVGFHVFNPTENTTYGGGLSNLPNIRFEINPDVNSITYSTLVWVPGPESMQDLDRWSPYIDATSNGYWYLTGSAGTATGCDQVAHCTLQQVKASFTAHGAQPTIDTVTVGYGRNSMWIGAVDGLRINQNIYDFERNGVRVLRAR